MRYILKGNGDIICTGSNGFEFVSEWSKEHPKESVLKKRSFRITRETYRKIAGASKEMFKRRKNKITFWTITSPKCVDHRLFNNIISDFLENLRKNHGLQSYIGVAEYQKRGAIHYHFLLDMPFISVTSVNSYLMRVGNRYNVIFSNNSVRLPPSGGVVQTSESVTNYICKYMSKSDVVGTRYDAKCYFITHNLIRKDVYLSESEYEKLIVRRGLVVGQTIGDHITVSHTARDVDVYGEILQSRQKKRVIYDDLRVKIQHEYFLRHAQTGELDFDGRRAEINKQSRLQWDKELAELDAEKAREKLERFRKWKEKREKYTESGQKSTEKHYYVDEITQKNKVFRYLCDRDTGEVVRLYQWFFVYSFKKRRKKENKYSYLLNLC